MKKFLGVIRWLRDQNNDFRDRNFVLLTVIAVAACFIALIGDIIIGENIVEILALLGILIFVPGITYLSIHYNKSQLGMKIIVLGLVFLVQPSIFYFGGGVEGGGVHWIIFSYLYIGLIFTGAWRNVMFIFLTVFAVVSYAVAYMYPRLIYMHARRTYYFDSLISVVLVGLMIYIMIVYQNRLFRQETIKAKNEAKRAEELNYNQNRFFSSMSHEIRTPINTVLGLNEIILRQEDASDEIIKDARNIEGTGRLLLSLINDILDVSKIESGKMEIVPVDYNVGELISEVVNMVWLKAEEKGLEFRVDIDPSAPSVLYGDDVRIKQVLINLLNNSVKYTTHGQVELHMEAERTGERGVLLKFTVTDTGLGMKKESLPYIFDSFQRVDESKNKWIEGTGLGLSIVKQLVELMDGEITVNSVYGQGSAFMVSLPQRVSVDSPIGTLNIVESYSGKRGHFQHSFRAPGVRILIVDDNEMNLQVESKLLHGTGIAIDLAMSGEEALKKTLSTRYDMIFMDHLMPVMDGIECLNNIRKQTGGFNRGVPVVALTANAGAANKELYGVSGFDGYLLKPVTGLQLEEMLLRFIPEDKIIRDESAGTNREMISTTSSYKKKKPVIITASSVCDLPASTIKELMLDIIPYTIHTGEGVFHDNIEIDSDELIRYLSIDGKEARVQPPTTEEFVDFFAEKLKDAHHVIHIAMTKNMSEEYLQAKEAAGTFDDVTVIDSGCLSSATGLLILIAHKLSEMNEPVERIVDEIESAKNRIHCSFILKDTRYMMKRGFIKRTMNKIMDSLTLRVSLKINSEKFSIEKLWLGSLKNCYSHYVRRQLKSEALPDKDVMFITYSDISEEDLHMIREEAERRVHFRNIIIQKASAAITANCGSGTVGILYMDRGPSSYNLSSLLPREDEGDKEVPDAVESAQSYEAEAPKPVKWYEAVPGIDSAEALRNCGSETAFKEVLQVFYDSIEQKSRELQDFYEAKDWENYTIKVHSLKSGSRLIGAHHLGDEAEKLELSGKNGDIDYIEKNHRRFLDDYRGYGVLLKDCCVSSGEEPEGHVKPEADREYINEVYGLMKEAAENMDMDLLDEAFLKLQGLSLPEGESEKLNRLMELHDSFDYAGILEIVGEENYDA